MSHFVRSASLVNYAEIAHSVGLDPLSRLRAVGISYQALLDPDTKISATSVSRLLESSARASKTEDFGLRMAETRQLANLGPLAIALREEPTLRRAVEAMARYMRLHNEALATRIEETDGLVMIRCDTLGRQLGPARQSTELVVGVMYRILQLFLGPAWRPRSICFAHAAPVSNATHLRVFSIAPMFNQEFDGIVCRSADLEVALPSYNPAVAQQAHQYLDTLLAQSSACMADKVRQVVLSMLPVGSCSVERVALQLGVDRRTVHHHLSATGESYSTILAAVRKELVERYAANKERSLSEVAELLGFASLSAFSRWFRHEYGCSVSRWRARPAP
ncbi:AraC family transcriptional regulator [Ottowia sp.]|jgi:AraC-like DNA-binding protein|uniref:AraC family transcriptional regulator n=1 Tax=Ottowia sp. TaxID=1898956 RepID=UPI0025E72181|nr:AraC family transcriptional regulator [Ottowia sp.]MBK6613797.1 AraC family transcriptional regulator [Ottowia sp.]MBK6748394.1 AraC family transcriptional regulator [Ottowia sp.]